ncbi:MAG: ribosome silencing factor [Endomicrobiia bacterium]
MVNTKLKARNLAKKSARILWSKKCKNISVLDVSKITSICDYFVIATVESNVQMKTAIDTLITELKKNGYFQIFREQTINYESPSWKTLDYGSVIIHIMSKQAREFYSLEKIWYKAKKVKFLTSKKRKK